MFPNYSVFRFITNTSFYYLTGKIFLNLNPKVHQNPDGE